MKRLALVTMAAAIALGTAGCGKKATGQVVAVVNGQEISQQELNAEIQAAGAGAGADRKAASVAALQRLIDRKLLVQEAKKQGLDRTPEYLLQSRRTEDDLLVGLMANKANKLVNVPDTAAIAQYMAGHPTMFAQRTRYQLEQVAFPTPKDAAIVKRLEPVTDWNAALQILTQAGIKLNRSNSVLDTASIPPAMAQEIAALKPGEPFIVPIAGGYVVNVIRGQEIVPVNETEARPAAATMVRRQKIDESLQAQVKAARTAAQIEYQPGFAPPAKAR